MLGYRHDGQKGKDMVILRGAGFDIVQENDGYWEIDYDFRNGKAYEYWIPLAEEEVKDILRRNK